MQSNNLKTLNAVNVPIPGDRTAYRQGTQAQRPRPGRSPHGVLAVLCATAGLAAIAGCTTFGPIPTEAELAAIMPGMTRDEVVARVGRPTWIFGVRQENLTIWNYRYNHNDCVIYQISIRPDGHVKDASQGYDPLCDGPRHFGL